MKPTKKLARKITPSSGLLGGLTQSLIDDPLRNSLDPAGLISKKDKPAEAVAEVAAMPMANDEAAKAARRRRMQMNQARSGRQSTLLSTTDTLG